MIIIHIYINKCICVYVYIYDCYISLYYVFVFAESVQKGTNLI
jgi:hypothetical protein